MLQEEISRLRAQPVPVPVPIPAPVQVAVSKPPVVEPEPIVAEPEPVRWYYAVQTPQAAQLFQMARPTLLPFYVLLLVVLLLVGLPLCSFRTRLTRVETSSLTA